MLKKQDPTWEDIVSKQLPGGMEEEDWGREEGSQPVVEPQFKDAPIAVEASQEEVMVELVVEETMEESLIGELPAEHVGEATIGPGSQDVVQIHAGEDDL